MAARRQPAANFRLTAPPRPSKGFAMTIQALIFDVDGTLAETEEVHRLAFNAAFAEVGLAWTWDRDVYRDLLSVTGGKERMRLFANWRGLSAEAMPDAEIARVHALKNVRYAEMVARGECPLRPGVERLIRAARARGLRLAICTTTTRVNIDALIGAALGAEGMGFFDVVVAGEDVRRKKPAPDAYLLAIEALKLAPARCLVFEDSRNGLDAALAAGLTTIVSPSYYTSHETFEGAAQVLPDLSQFALPAVAPASPAGPT
jgi:HAD superfamily hydrolase (TIGR01509 family)